jgi:NADPH-dependent curcumin reductase CurA
LRETAPVVKAGHLRYVEDRVRGLDQAPALFERLMNGANTGKCVVGVSPL